jgi:hypothetical protein
VPVALVFLAAWIAVRDALPAVRQERAERAAAAFIAAAGRTPEEVAARATAADRLADAWARWPKNLAPRLEILDQLEWAAGITPDADERAALFERAYEVATAIEAEHGAGGVTADRVYLADGLADAAAASGDADAAATYRAIAMDCARRLVDLDPYGLAPQRRLADLAWKHGLTVEARDAYRRTLELDANLDLDPVRRLTAEQRAEIERRLAEIAPAP